MRPTRAGARAIATLALTLLTACSAHTPPEAPRPGPAEQAEDAADALLRRMSDTLSAAQRLSFEADRQADAALLPGRELPERARIHVEVARPDRLRARSVSPERTRTLIFDGRRVVVHDEGRNLYAVAETSGDIDAMADALERRFGFVPPLVEFVSPNPYTRIRGHVTSARLEGRDTIDGVSCERVAYRGEHADGHLWIARDTALPCRLTAVFRDEGSPRMRVDFSGWDLAASFPTDRFVFRPPAGADRILMVPREDLDATDVAGQPATGTGGSR